MNNRILLTGATGFIGSAVLRSFTPSERARTTALIRSDIHLADVGKTVIGDLRDRDALRIALDGVGTVVHAASYIGYDVGLCREVNEVGTLALTQEATSRGVSRMIYVSTAAVLGSGPHRGRATAAAFSGSLSPLSASRLAAE